MDQKVFLNKIKEQVLKEDENASVILYGSRARGDYREDSDWDILVLTSKEVDGTLKRRIRDEIYEVQLEYLQPVSTLVYNRNFWSKLEITPLFKNVAKDGKAL
ncbi:MAG: polymerase subunit beta [Segetibacter sp.]|nr:polymerase subunit beta [Segetibacter sp.]